MALLGLVGACVLASSSPGMAATVPVHDGDAVLALEPVAVHNGRGQTIAAPVYRLDAVTLLAATPRVIVSTRTDAAPDAWPQVRHIARLARLDGQTLWLAEIDSAQQAVAIADRLGNLPGVRYAQPDFIVIDPASGWRTDDGRHAADGVLSLASRVSLAPLWQRSRGRGVRVAVIDDGFQLAHRALERVTLAAALDADDGAPRATPRSPLDRHGTGVASVLFADGGEYVDGIAPEAQLIAIRRTLNRSSDIVRAFDFAYRERADVINCSWVLPYVLRPVADSLHFVATRGRHGLGTLIVVAAGNRAGDPGRHSLAASPDVLAVNGLDRDGRLLAAHGVGIDLTAPTRWRVASVDGNDGLGVLAGTSGAAPVVSGVAALLLARYPNLSRPALVAALTASARPLALPDRTATDAGAGLIDPPAALQRAAGIANGRHDDARVPARTRPRSAPAP